EEACHDVRIFGDDGFCMVGGIGVDVFDCARNAVDERHRNDGVEIFGAPVFVGSGLQGGENLEHRGRCADFAACLGQGLQERFQMRTDRGVVDEQGFGSAANPCPAHLCVDDDPPCHVEVG